LATNQYKAFGGQETYDVESGSGDPKEGLAEVCARYLQDLTSGKFPVIIEDGDDIEEVSYKPMVESDDRQMFVVLPFDWWDTIAVSIDQARHEILASVTKPEHEEDAEMIATLLLRYDKILDVLEAHGASW
jgi:hypothetical protein